MENILPPQSPTPPPPPKKTSSGLDWVLWWRVGDDEIKRQVEGYQTFKIHQSARGVSFLLTLLSAGLTTLFILLGGFNPSAFVDVALILFLGSFVLLGRKWAMVGIMILWTLEKLLSIQARASSVVIQLAWWVIFMHQFYLAYKVEKSRGQISPPPQTVNPSIN